MTQTIDSRDVKPRSPQPKPPMSPVRKEAIEKIADLFGEIYGPAMKELEKR